ncbi:exosortase-dependent surface protein XDP1 [Inhella proteolytica]|uniref:PEP-CTERM sorting domain-containing protein n=1 Tax=Inhella proteolytica TaxID=2795029 RepID=A0A931IX43_9BURK|nr:exosortase-dependent surface protein XDP1 [Inhella proteolytica]MBH9575331.1 PEP-CTERM sorting domain-containing protein [Inhella proteolytica]
MKKSKLISQLALATAMSAASLAPQTASALTTWGNGGCVWSGDMAGNLCTIGTGNAKVNVTAYGTTDLAPVQGWETATLMNYSGGFGVKNRGTNDPGEGTNPEHAIDNNGNNGTAGGFITDALLFSFEQSTILRNLTIGWKSGDADISVLRYTGQLPPVLTDKTPSGLLSSGWQLVGQYGNVTTNTNQAINASGGASSWWLVTAYNSAFQNKGWTMGDDYFKLLSVAGDQPPPQSQTPEPASLALVGLAALSLGYARRRRLPR